MPVCTRATKNGLHCVAACGNCRGDGCENESPKVNVEEINNIEDEDGNIFDILMIIDY